MQILTENYNKQIIILLHGYRTTSAWRKGGFFINHIPSGTL